MKSVHQIQPTKCSCGQTCVAMISGVPVQKVIHIVGHNGPTWTSDLIKAFRKLGIKPKRRKYVAFRKKSKLGQASLVRLRWRKKDRKGSHLIAYIDGKFYDPYPKQDYFKNYAKVSYMRIK